MCMKVSVYNFFIIYLEFSSMSKKVKELVGEVFYSLSISRCVYTSLFKQDIFSGWIVFESNNKSLHAIKWFWAEF